MNLDIMSRNENARDKFHTEVVQFQFDDIKQHFVETLEAIKAQFDVVDQLIEARRVTESENVWRAQILFLASALDFYMHELTKCGLCKIYNEGWEKTDKYKNLKVNMEVIEVALKSGEEVDWFLEYINEYYQSITMVSFDSVKSQLNLLGIDLITVANTAFYQQGATEKPKDKLKRCLNGLFHRRNIIAHQADREHKNAQMNNISKEIVKDYIDDIEKIVYSIDKEIRNKEN